jgi:sterol desaturase/sphingolipid hydroxylase (fatty acid hydroxylase superfamily)
MHIAIEAISTSIESLASNSDIYVFTGLDERIKKANRVSSSWVRAGIYCLLTSTFLAVWSLYAEQSGAEPKASSNWLPFSGFQGIIVGIGVLCTVWLLIWIKLNGTEFHFDAQGKEAEVAPQF